MAVGEAACVSVHGGQRLGSNSLLDLVCSAAPAANRWRRDADACESHKSCPHAGEEAIARFDACATPRAARGTAQAPLWPCSAPWQNDCAVFRTQSEPRRGLQQPRQGDRRAVPTSGQGSLADLELRPGDAEFEKPDPARPRAPFVRPATPQGKPRRHTPREDYPERDDKE